MSKQLNAFIWAIVIFEVFFLIGLAFLLNQWWFWGGAVIFGSLAPLEMYYKYDRNQ